MSEKKLVLIDGYGFLFRAYFAIKNLKRSDGVSVNGVYCFTKMIMNLIADINTTHIAVIFDSGSKTFRHEIYSEYKANRPQLPDDLIPQFSMIRDVTKALHLKTIEKVGYEADDIIATLAKKAENEGFNQIMVVSSDKDLMQLVDDKVFMFDAMKSKIIHEDEVIEKWGVKPKQVLDVLSLIGDASDNVPGVPSIGPKTASDLVNKFGSVDAIIENIDDIEQQKRREIIKSNLDKLLLSKKLISLEYNVDLEESLDDLKINPINPSELINFFNSMEFFSLAKKVKESFKVEKNNINNDLFQVKRINNYEVLDECIENLLKNNKIYLDIITNNNDEYENFKNITIIDENKKYKIYIPLFDNYVINDLFSDNTDKGTLKIADVVQKLKVLFENDKIKKISYNTKKIIRILKQYDIILNNYDDISVMSYVLDAGKFEHTLPSLIKNYLFDNVEINIKNIENIYNIIEQYEKGKDIEKIGQDIYEFSLSRIEIIYRLYGLINDRLENSEQKQLYLDLEKPLIEVLADMEFNGIKIDINELNNLSKYFLEKLSAIEKEIFSFAGCEFNILSPKQLGEILFEKLEIPTKKKKSSKSGYYSTDSEILENLAEKGYLIADKILEYRQYSKLKLTYSDVLPKLIDKNGRVHTTFSNISVTTGRLSSYNPNLQNIPIKSEDGAKIRKAFVAKNGYKLVGADYSQIELRVLAEYAKVKKLIESFKNGEDIHTRTAMEVFGTENITPEMRRMAKIINFSIIYGTTSFGLAKRLNSSNNVAKSYMDNYFNRYPEIKIYMDKIVDFVNRNGFVKTLFNRRCYIDVNGSTNKQLYERLAINAPIQGTAADIIKMVMVKLNDKLKEYDAKILLQIHDELIVEVEEKYSNEVADLVKNTMENIVNFSVPLIADVKIGNSWSEIH